MRNDAFARLLNTALAQADRSASWLARQIGVSPSTVTRWLSEETYPDSPQVVLTIAKVLDIDAQALLKAAGYSFQLNGHYSENKAATATSVPPMQDVATMQSALVAPDLVISAPSNQPTAQHAAVHEQLLPTSANRNADAPVRKAPFRFKLHWLLAGLSVVIVAAIGITASCLAPIGQTAPTPTPLAPPTNSPASAPAQFNFYGPVNTFIKDVNNSVIIVGDSPEAKEQKAKQRAALITGELRYYIENIDARLGFVATTLVTDTFEEDLAKTRATVAPALQQIARDGYRRLIATNQVEALRQQFNSKPLIAAPSAALIQLATDSGVNVEQLRYFYTQMGEVQQATDALLAILSRTGTGNDEAARPLQKKWITLDSAVLQNQAALAYLAGLKVMNDFATTYPDTTVGLNQVAYLAPRQLLDDATADQQIRQLAAEREKLLQKRGQLLEEEAKLRDQALQEYQKLQQALLINSSDEPKTVVAKAISLRQLGRTAEAVDAFTKYETMFTASDSTAKQYAQVARQFTLQIALLGVVDGAVYLFAVQENSVAQRSGLAVGDIVIEFNGHTIQNPNDLQAALQTMTIGAPLTLIYLRMDAQSIFHRQTITLTGTNPIGFGFMPI